MPLDDVKVETLELDSRGSIEAGRPTRCGQLCQLGCGCC